MQSLPDEIQAKIRTEFTATENGQLRLIQNGEKLNEVLALLAEKHADKIVERDPVKQRENGAWKMVRSYEIFRNSDQPELGPEWYETLTLLELA